MGEGSAKIITGPCTGSAIGSRSICGGVTQAALSSAAGFPCAGSNNLTGSAPRTLGPDSNIAHVTSNISSPAPINTSIATRLDEEAFAFLVLVVSKLSGFI
jgi:hypothetical protein